MNRVWSRKKTRNCNGTFHLIQSSMLQIPLVVITSSDQRAIIQEWLRSELVQRMNAAQVITSSKAGELHHGLLINRAGIHSREWSRDGSFSDSAVCDVRCCIQSRATASWNNLKSTTPRQYIQIGYQGVKSIMMIHL